MALRSSLFLRNSRVITIEQNAVLWSKWAPRNIPCFNIELLRDLERGSQSIESYFSAAPSERPLRHVVLRSAIGNVFNVGGDLGYFQRLIAAQDRVGLHEYARIAIDVVYRNYTSHNLHGITTIALLRRRRPRWRFRICVVLRRDRCREACKSGISRGSVQHVSREWAE